MHRKARTRAAAEGIPFNIDVEDCRIPTHCPALGIPLISGNGRGGASDNSPSLDKIIPSLGYIKGNVQVISMRANRIKSDAALEEIEMVAAYTRRCLATK